MNDLQIFTYQQSTVRTVERDGEPWFVLKDVCDVLGISNPTVVANRLDADEVAKFDLGGLSGEANVINESGLYNVILRSDKPEAKPFRKWVTSEVIPAIRRHGSYSRKPLTPAEQLLAQANVLVEQERRLSALEETAEKTSRAIEMIAAPAASTRDTWQEETGKAIRQMCAEYALNYHSCAPTEPRRPSAKRSPSSPSSPATPSSARSSPALCSAKRRACLPTA